jgi:hypothetical protein
MKKSEKIAEMYRIYANRIGKTKLDVEELTPLILNIAYLEVAQAKRSNEPYNTRTVFNEYTNAAVEVIPEYINEIEDPRFPTLYIGFNLTCEWDGLWNFLRDYFDTKLGVKIDNESRKIYRYDSAMHKRFENNHLVMNSDLPRKVNINLSNDFKNAQFSISESLSNKEANLISIQANKYTYRGTDPVYLFEFILDTYDNVEFFCLTRTDRNVRIEYFE